MCVKNLTGLQTAFWNFSLDQADTHCEKRVYASRTFAELLTLARLSAFRLPALPAIDTKPGSAALPQANCRAAAPLAEANSRNGRDGNFWHKGKFPSLPFDFCLEEYRPPHL